MEHIGPSNETVLLSGAAGQHQPVSVLELPLVERALLDLDLLIQQGKLIITPYELRSQDVPLPNHNVILLLLPQLLLQLTTPEFATQTVVHCKQSAMRSSCPNEQHQHHRQQVNCIIQRQPRAEITIGTRSGQDPKKR